LFRFAAGCLLDAIVNYDNGELAASGVPLFDELGQAQKLAMLSAVSKALLDESVPSPKLTALNEATVAAVYERLLSEEILTEIDETGETEARQKVLATMADEFESDGVAPPN